MTKLCAIRVDSGRLHIKNRVMILGTNYGIYSTGTSIIEGNSTKIWGSEYAIYATYNSNTYIYGGTIGETGLTEGFGSTKSGYGIRMFGEADKESVLNFDVPDGSIARITGTDRSIFRMNSTGSSVTCSTSTAMRLGSSTTYISELPTKSVSEDINLSANVKYPIYVNGTQFMTTNIASGIACGTGTAKLTVPANTTSGTYILTLENATINQANDLTGFVSAIRSERNLKIVLEGTNTIIVPAGTYSSTGIEMISKSALSITGTGSLQINATKELTHSNAIGDSVNGIYTDGSIVINCDTLKIDAKDIGIRYGTGLDVLGNTQLTVNTTDQDSSYGIYGIDGGFDLAGNANASIGGFTRAIMDAGNHSDTNPLTIREHAILRMSVPVVSFSDGINNQKIDWSNCYANPKVITTRDGEGEKLWLTDVTPLPTTFDNGYLYIRISPQDEIISSIVVNGVTAPTIGAHPDTTVSVPSGSNYNVFYVTTAMWYNINDQEWMTSSDTFEPSKAYRLVVNIEPNQDYALAPALQLSTTLSNITAASYSVSSTTYQVSTRIGRIFNFDFVALAVPSGVLGVDRTGVENFVDRCYVAMLGRHAEDAGLQDWTNLISNREICAAQLAYGIMYSDEFQRLSITDDEFLNRMYYMFFNREPDGPGKAMWLAKLQSGAMTRDDIFRGFVNSEEYFKVCKNFGITAGYYVPNVEMMRQGAINCYVERLYITCLGRVGDMSGQICWVKHLIDGDMTAEEVTYGFIFSNELTSRNVSDAEFVSILYSACFGREPDTEGYSHWMNALAGGLSREDCFRGFANSAEFRALCNTYGVR